MNEHPIKGLVESIMESLTQMSDVSTVVGEPIITPIGVTIIPISKVTVGFGLGGGNYNGSAQNATDQNKSPFGGGGGGAVTISPVAFLTVTGENVKLLTIDRHESTLDKALAMAPEMVDKVISTIRKDSPDSRKADPAEPYNVINMYAEHPSDDPDDV